MNDRVQPAAFLSAQLADCENHWSLGTFGALAEFTRDAGESVALSQAGHSFSAVTERGGIRIVPCPAMRLFASESATRESWYHRVAFCLPQDACAMGRRSVLTELGPDADALRERDRAAVLFDLGLDAPHVDACIRVADESVAAALRAHAGRPVFEHGNPAMGIIVKASPHRVFLSRVGRVEVFQPIPPPDGKSPEGPHTHVLPKLLRSGRTHAATEPIPEGWVPCAHLYPAHPVKDATGLRRPFDRSRHGAFQEMLLQFGDADVVALKRRVAAAVAAGQDPSALTFANGRFARAAVRVALRQMQAVDASLPALAAWLHVHDRAQPVSDDDDGVAADHHSHSHAPSCA